MATKNLLRRQLAQTRAEVERDLKKKDREKLLRLRDSIKLAKVLRKDKLRGVTTQCRTARAQNMERAKRARQRLRDSIQRTRERARGLCSVSRGEALGATLREIEKAIGALEEERTLQRQLAVWTRPKSCPVSRGTGRGERAEKRQESDCEVSANLDDPGMRLVWEHVKHKIKASPRRTRTEAFFEWVHEHSADVYAIQEADAERALRELEQEERKLSREIKKAGRYKRHSHEELTELLEAVPF